MYIIDNHLLYIYYTAIVTPKKKTFRYLIQLLYAYKCTTLYNCIIQIGIVYYWFYLIAVKYLSLIDKSRDWRYKEEDLGSFPSHAHSQWVWFEEAQTNTMPSAMEVPVHPGPWPWRQPVGFNVYSWSLHLYWLAERTSLRYIS